MRNLLEICCGLDVHKEILVACMLKGSLENSKSGSSQTGAGTSRWRARVSIGSKVTTS